MEALTLCDIIEVYIYYLFIYLRLYTTIFHNIVRALRFFFYLKLA